MKTVLIDGPIHIAAVEHLRQEVEVLTPYDASREKLLDLLSDVHGLILRGLTIEGAEMDRAKQLEVIARHGAGFDNVDITAATERGIPVVYTPYGPTESTAEHAFLLMLASARRLPHLDRAVRNENFQIREWLRGRELRDTALGVAGFGRIGRRMAEMCRDALDMSIHVFDPYVDPGEIVEWGAAPVDDLVGLADMVDVLSVHVPLTEETRHLIDRNVLSTLGENAILVNASRGAVVDEAALIDALRDGELGAAGLDVFDPEPPSPDNPLLQMDQVVLTPHAGSATEEGRRRMGMMVVEDTLRVLRGEKPRARNVVNPEALS